MALVLKDRVKETTTTTGTGTITLAGAVSGFQSFSAIGNGNSTYYVIADPATGAWEVGIGTYTSSGTTLSRTTVLSSSNAGSLVTFAAGVKDVFVSYPSSRSVYLDSAGSAVTTLDIGTLGTSTANITTANITAGTITTAPVNNTDIVNKAYADAIASGIHFHEAVDLATTAALPANTYNNGTGGVGATLTGNSNGALSVDSTLTVVGNRILVKNEVAGANNGVYVVTQVGSGGAPYILTRATDFDSVGTGVDQIDEGDFFLVTNGTANANTAWVQQTPPPITLGTTALVFQQFSAPITYTAGTGLSESPAYTFNIANIGTAGTYGSASSVPVITTNAQGQVTGVTPTAIAISGAAVSGNISGSAGSVANALTAGTYLTSGGTYNGSAARTFAVDATDANTASKVVARDGSGNFSAGTITATLSGAATSATTATNLAGGAVNRIAVQSGSGTTTFVVAPTASGQVLRWNGSSFDYVAGTISGAALGGNISTLTFGTFLTGTSYNGTGAVTIATNATNANTASTLVARDASGNFSAGTITAALSGNATTASTAGSITSQANSATITATSANTANQIVLRDASGNFAAGTITATLNGNASTATSATTSGSTSGNAATATALQTARNIGGVSFNGTADINLPGVNTAGNQNTSGNAATATALSSGQSNWVGTGVINNVVGLLAWKNYSNSHVIFDASAGTSPSGGAVNNTNAAVAWTSTYPTLMGWNGSSTYGVRVDSARVSDNTSGTAANVTGIVAIANGGTGQSTRQAAMDALAGAVTAGQYLRGDGVDVVMSAIQAGDVPTLNQNTTGNAASATVLQTARTINGTSFNGSANITITANTTNTLTLGTGLGGTSFNGSAAVTATVSYGTSAGTACQGNDSRLSDARQATNTNTQLASLGVGTAASGTAGEIRATNNVTAYFSSDIKFKENVRDIPNAAATAAYIGGKLFDWTDAYIAEHGGVDGYFVQKNDFGVVAQDVLKAFPIAVRTRPDGSLAVDYEKLSALALAAVAEQEVRIAKLEAIVAKLIEG